MPREKASFAATHYGRTSSCIRLAAGTFCLRNGTRLNTYCEPHGISPGGLRKSAVPAPHWAGSSSGYGVRAPLRRPYALSHSLSQIAAWIRCH